jgi:DNA-binding NarL/FixJ family response regulator
VSTISVEMATRVLIVDDHPSFRTGARRLLEAEGFEVVGEAEDGATAIAATASLHPELVLLDVNLPDLDGFQVTQRIVAAGGPPVVLTSSRDRADYGDCVDVCGARGFVHKADLSGLALTALLP